MKKQETKPGEATIAVTTGRSSRTHHGVVNTPVYHASTILHSDLASFERRHQPGNRERVVYGLLGTPTTFDLERAVADLESGHDAVLTSSGLSAVSIALLAFLRTGDHVLVADTVYAWTRIFCDEVLPGLGIAVTYYDPLTGSNIESLIEDNTRVIFLESPGSLTFEIQDVPAITAIARARGITTILDNTWATPLFFKSFEHGVDVSVHAATKYLSGHGDIMMGVIVSNERCWQVVHRTRNQFGQCVGPDDAYVTLRSLRTLPVRMQAHQEQGIALAQWLATRTEVARVLHPALPAFPGHALWQRDFLGAAGLFGVVLEPCPRQALVALVNGLELFGIGASWGGYQSLLIPVYPEKNRSVTTWDEAGPVLRIHAGLESLSDLVADLEAGFARLGTAV